MPEDDREAIVAATVTEAPLQVERLWLTSQGSFLDLSGEWVNSARAAYLHRSTAGRDLHVEVTERGYLAPFGHPATITTVTERQFRPDANGEPTAILVQDDYLAVSGATVTFPAPHMPDEGRAIPFPTVGVTDAGAGPVERAAITLADGTTISTDNAWVVTRNDADAMVSYTATDRTGRNGITFTMPAIFVIERHAFTVQDEVNGVRTPLGNLNTFFDEAPASRVEPDLGGQLVGWADPHPRGTAGSDRVTSSMRITLDRPALDGGTTPSAVRAELEAAGRPAFYPRVEHASVVDETTSALLGGDGSAIQVQYAASWLANGNEAGNPGLAFHTLVDETAVERSGSGSGLVKPALAITTFSQTLGAGTELALRSNLTGEPEAVWNPGEALKDTAVLFGRVLLSDIVGEVSAALGSLSSERGMPRFETLLEEEGLFYVMTWEPELRTFPEQRRADLRARSRRQGVVPTGAAGAVRTQHPGRHRVRARPGRRGPAAAAGRAGRGDRLQAGPLLRAARGHQLPGVEAERLAVHRCAGFPGAGPRGGRHAARSREHRGRSGGRLRRRGDPRSQPRVRGGRRHQPEDRPRARPAQLGPSKIGFNLSRREDPFCITVMGFGGTGSFELRLVADDIDFLHASMAAAYELAVSIAIVSASVRAALGIELSYKGEGGVILGAYVELSANASVLGLVNLTGKVLLALQLQPRHQAAQGPRDAQRRGGLAVRPLRDQLDRDRGGLPRAPRPARPPCAPERRHRSRRTRRRSATDSPSPSGPIYCSAFAAA